MKKNIFLLLLVALPGCGGDIMNSFSDNVVRLTVSDAIVEAGSGSATVRFTTNIPAYDRIEYGLVSGAYTLNTADSSSALVSHSVSLTGLASNAVYYARVVCSVAGQVAVSSGEFSFSTYSTITVSSLTVSGTTLTGTQIDWTTNVPTTHLVEYGIASGSYTDSTVQSSTESASHSVSLTGLSPNTVYYYRVKNFSTALGENTGAEQSFSTSTQTFTVTGITPSSVMQSSTEITWMTDPGTLHRVEYGTTSGLYSWSTVESQSLSTSHSVLLTNLFRDTTYFYVVYNIHPILGVKVSAEGSFTTSGLTVSGIAAGSVTYTTAEISWKTNVGTTDLVEYGTSSGSYSAATMQSSTSSTSHSVTLSGLAAGTIYYYRVKNYHQTYGNIASSEYSFSTTSETAPTAAQRSRGIWMLGGLNAQAVTVAANTVGAVDLFDPDTNTWYPSVTTLPTPVSFAAAVGFEGKIYVMGGFDNSGAVIGKTQIYDVASGVWSAGANMSNARANHSAVALGGNIYVTRGTTGSYSAAWTVLGTPVNSLIYSISADSWTSTGVVDSAVSNKSAVAVGGVVYYLGGRSTTSAVVNTVDGIITSANSLTGLTEVVTSSTRAGSSAVAYTGANGSVDIIMIGGFTALNSAGCYALNSVTTATATNLFQYLRYPFYGVSWYNASAAGTFPSSLGFGSAVISGSTLYWFGGTSGGTSPSALNVVYSYDMDTFPSGSWTDLTGSKPMPQVRFGHNAVIAY